MKIFKTLWLFILLASLTGCATLNQGEINNANRRAPDSLQLQPMLDIFSERIDIVRNKTDRELSTEGEGSEDMPYHDAGFYLGNGLFYDLNGNLCFLVLKGSDINISEPFRIEKKDHTTLFNRISELKWGNNTYSINIKKGIGFSQHWNVKKNDSITELIKGKLSKQKLTLHPNGDYEYDRALAGEKIQKSDKGYFIKNLLSRDDYIKKEQAVFLRNDIVIRNRNNALEILRLGWKKEKLLYQMIFSRNSILIFNNKYVGYKILAEKSGVVKVYENQRLLKTLNPQ